MVVILINLLLFILLQTTPQPKQEYVVALQSFQHSAELLKLPKDDMKLINDNVKITLAQFKKEPESFKQYEAINKFIAIIQQRVRSTSFEKVYPYVNTLKTIANQEVYGTAHKLDGAGNPIPDDQ